MTHQHGRLAAIFALLLAITSCQSQSEPPSEDNNLRATISALQSTVEASSMVSQATEVARPAVAATTEPTADLRPTGTSAPVELEVGEAATENKFSLRLVKAETNLGIGGGGIDGIGPGIKLLFDLANNSTDNLPVGYGQENFSARDNLGNRLEFGWAHNYNGLLRTVDAKQLMIDSGSTVRLPWGDSRDAIFYVSCDITDPKITDVYVTVHDLGRISLATFRVRVPH